MVSVVIEASIVYEVRLSRIPCFKGLDDYTYHGLILEMCREIETAAAVERKGTSLRGMGVKRILRHLPHYIPERLDASPAPPVHCRLGITRRMYLAAYRAFVSAYKHAFQRLCEKVGGVGFPPGGHPPVGEGVLGMS